MTRKPTEAERAKELEKLDLLPKREAEKRADDARRHISNRMVHVAPYPRSRIGGRRLTYGGPRSKEAR